MTSSIFYIVLWFGLPLLSIILTSVFLCRRKYKGIRDFKALWYRVNLHYNRKAPHELRSDLIHWEKGDKVTLLAGERGYTDWIDKDYIFKGFLEDSFVINAKLSATKNLEEVPAYKIPHYVNKSALDRMAEKENLRIESRLKTSMYAQLLETMKEQNKEIEIQMRQLNK
jgi:hypothetical protein